MPRRNAYRDETWRLALARDAEGLRRASELLAAADDGDYDGRRARAFSHALDGDAGAAVAALGAGATDDWPFPGVHAVDLARIRYLVGDHRGALDALRPAVTDEGPADPAVRALATAAVRAEPKLLRRAVAVVVARGPASRRVRDAAALVRARVGARRRLRRRRRATPGSGG